MRTCLPILLALLLVIPTTGCDKSDEKPDEQPTAEATEESDDSPAGSADTSENDRKAAESDEETDAAEPKRAQKPKFLEGPVQPGRVTEVYGSWRERLKEIDVKEADAKALTEVPEGAEVTVYFATWCSDSRREVPRLWRALEAADGDIPFSVDYIGVDRALQAEEVDLKGVDLQFVPTFVVRRDGKEVGRIVESAPDLLERDLAALLAGEKSGVVTGRN
jgi:thiol-disulfide isomerase/thioredoxin